MRRKIRELVDQADLARAMQRAANDRFRDLSEQLIAAQREINRVASAEERRRWTIPNRAPGSTVPGARSYADVVAKTEKKAARLRVRCNEAKARVATANQIAEGLVRPLERIAGALRLEQFGGVSDDPVRQLEDLAA
jgi:hypothetical protein